VDFLHGVVVVCEVAEIGTILVKTIRKNQSTAFAYDVASVVI
jgi:hypothetical protein